MDRFVRTATTMGLTVFATTRITYLELNNGSLLAMLPYILQLILVTVFVYLGEKP